MLWKQLFTPVRAIDPEEARAFMAKWAEGAYTLLDVRQPGEYEKEHLAGAKLVPMAALPESLKDLDREKPVIVY
jgi:sulfur-carrier protein adenylyltransferase/sulfurtransferase